MWLEKYLYCAWSKSSRNMKLRNYPLTGSIKSCSLLQVGDPPGDTAPIIYPPHVKIYGLRTASVKILQNQILSSSVLRVLLFVLISRQVGKAYGGEP